MFSFFKKDNQQVPGWANFFNPKEYKSFISQIEKYFGKLSISYQLLDGFIDVENNDWGFKQLGLVNVAQVCKQDTISNYEEIISGHFDALKRTNEFNEEFEKTEADFDKIKQYIGIRLYNPSYFDVVGLENTIGKELAPTIYATLIFDLPDSISNIKPEQAAKWGKANSELIKLGIENIKNNYEWEITEESIDTFKIWTVGSDHFFAPNILFELESRKDLLGEYGALIGAPHRHGVLIYPINNLEVIVAINKLIPIIYGMNQEGPGSLTAHLFYYNNGKLMDLPYELTKEKIEFTPPAEFLDILSILK